jgi:hypothetical protein
MTNHRLQSWAYQTARIGKETNLRVLALIKSQNKTQNKKTKQSLVSKFPSEI